MQKSFISRIIFFLAITLLFSSCAKENDKAPAQVPELYNYRFSYMDYPNSVMQQPGKPLDMVNLEYDANSRIIKRQGGLLPVNWSTGFSYYFSDSLYEEITYQGNMILITNKSAYRNMTVYPNRKLLTLDKGKIVNFIKETRNTNTTYDTTYFYYTNNALTRTIKKGNDGVLTKDFFYNASGNLMTIMGLALSRYQHDTLYFQTETFSDYDNAPNPVKQLTLFDELFYRSLSTNNYRKYELKKFGKDNTIFASESRGWNFKYDSEGKVNFAE